MYQNIIKDKMEKNRVGNRVQGDERNYCYAAKRNN